MPAAIKSSEVHASTSLQQLQSLEQDFHDLDAQLDQLGKILQEHELIDWNYLDHVKSAGRCPRSYGRLEWAMRWILGKLHAPGSGGLK